MQKTFINDRIAQIVNYLNVSPPLFAKSLGASVARIANVMAGRNKPDVVLLERIAEKYPQINATWLLTGKGDLPKAARPYGKYYPEDLPRPEHPDPAGAPAASSPPAPAPDTAASEALPLANEAGAAELRVLEQLLEVQQNQYWLSIDRQLKRVLKHLLSVQELLEDLVGIQFDDVGYRDLHQKIILRPRHDKDHLPVDPLAEMTDSQKRAHYAGRERLLEQCEAQFGDLLDTLHASIEYPANLDIPPRKGSAAEALRPLLAQRRYRSSGDDKEATRRKKAGNAL
ncbi:hypothetical protein [Hymenobacter sp.]|uniref:hypothetical protein n=1 Tax=Hymenobacter sp. TaxID=1898978 RepID=UPI00286B272B|nr:hypothetical protein [Hymenobacter sp.]